jgi:hypothetical protein
MRTLHTTRHMPAHICTPPSPPSHKWHMPTLLTMHTSLPLLSQVAHADLAHYAHLPPPHKWHMPTLLTMHTSLPLTSGTCQPCSHMHTSLPPPHKWHMPTLLTEYGGYGDGCYVQGNATAAGVGSAYWHYSDYCWPKHCPGGGADGHCPLTGELKGHCPLTGELKGCSVVVSDRDLQWLCGVQCVLLSTLGSRLITDIYPSNKPDPHWGACITGWGSGSSNFHCQ